MASKIEQNSIGLQNILAMVNALPEAGSGEVEITLQEKSVTPTKSAQAVTADSGYDGLSKVNVGAIPDEYIVPSGTKTITANGEHDVTSFAKASVNVPIPDGYVKPSGTLNITENGTYDVTEKESVSVSVAGSGGGGVSIETCTVTLNVVFENYTDTEDQKLSWRDRTVLFCSLENGIPITKTEMITKSTSVVSLVIVKNTAVNVYHYDELGIGGSIGIIDDMVSSTGNIEIMDWNENDVLITASGSDELELIFAWY